MTPSGQRAVSIDLLPVWQDHRFQGRAVLPAVEAMQLLAGWAQEWRPGLRATHIQQVRFDKFLALPAGRSHAAAICELAELADGGVRATLLTRTPAKSAAFTRTREHARMHIINCAAERPEPVPRLVEPMQSDLFEVPATRVYSDLVPFGPGYHTICRPVQLCPAGALAGVHAPDGASDQNPGPLGNPFVLDAAFHAACVWGQRYAGVVAFPVGMAERVVVRPTQSGQSYTAHVAPVQHKNESLIFDLWILDQQGRLAEAALGLQMRDIGGGRWQPPAWVMET